MAVETSVASAAAPTTWWRGRWLILLSFAVVLVVSVPNREYFGHEDAAERTQITRHDDIEFAKDGSPPEGHDDWSYLAAARHPFEDSYLVRREPYLSRFLQPLIAHGLTLIGLDADHAFFAITSLALLSAALAIRALCRDLGANSDLASLGGALFLLAPTVTNGFLHASHVDPGAWALMFWSLHFALRHRFGPAFATLVAALLWRETSLLIAPTIIVWAFRRGERRLLGIGVVSVALAVALPRVLLASSFNPGLVGLGRLVVLGLRQKVQSPINGGSQFLHALSVGLILVPFGVAPLRKRNTEAFIGLGVIAAAFVLLGLLSNDGARLMPPACAFVIPAAVLALQDRLGSDRKVTVALFVGGFFACLGWVLGGFVLVAQLATIVVVLGMVLRYSRNENAPAAEVLI